MPQNEEDLSYMFEDETTPVKACGDLAYKVNNSGKIVLWYVAFMTSFGHYALLIQTSVDFRFR